jgi:hypothetical protein
MSEIAIPYPETERLETNEPPSRSTREDAIILVVERILDSRHLTKSQLLSTLLLYICRRAFDDPGARITEQELGTKVFERGLDFDPRADNIVRNYTRQLRTRLQSFYALEGIDETIVIDIPRGGYVPTFTRRSVPARGAVEHAGAGAAAELVLPVPPPTPASVNGFARLRLATLLTFGVLSCLILIWAIGSRSTRTVKPDEASADANPLWSKMFSSDRNTIVVPADTAFVILQQANHRTFSLSEYLRWFSAKEPTNEQLAMAYLRGENYTSMSSLQIAAILEKLPEVVQNRFMIRAPRALRFEDLREDNIILLGSSYSNPWCELFERQLNFRVVNHPESDHYQIVDEHPDAGGSTLYESRQDQHSRVTYASIALLPNLSGKGHVLIIQGLDAAGTWGATEFLLHKFKQDPLTKTISLTNGTINNFEYLIEVTCLDDNSGTTSSRVLMKRNIPG